MELGHRGASYRNSRWRVRPSWRGGRSARRWFYLSLFISGVTALVPLLPPDLQAVRYVAFVYLFTWYFVAGRPQVRYVAEKYGPHYPRQPWRKALLIATALLAGYVVVVLVLTAFFLILMAVTGART